MYTKSGNVIRYAVFFRVIYCKEMREKKMKNQIRKELSHADEK